MSEAEPERRAMLQAVFRHLLAYVLAVGVALIAASAASTHFVVAGLEAIGAEIGVSERIDMVLNDLKGLGPTYGVVIAVGFAIALPVGWLIGQILKPIRFLRFPLAGAAAIGAALYAMLQLYDVIPIIGAQSTEGFAAQLAAGALGGLVFAVLRGAK